MSLNFSLVTRPYSTSNAIQVALFKTSSPTVVAYSQEVQGPTSQLEWSFPGIARSNYIVKIYEIENGAVIQTYDSFTIVPAEKGLMSMKDSVWVTAGLTEGFSSGVIQNTIEDWVGWDITIHRESGGVMVVDDQYNWDKSTGTITLLKEGDAFGVGERFFVEFTPQQTTDADGGVPEAESSGGGSGFSSLKIVNANYTIALSDLGTKLLCLDGSPYFELQLPDLSSVPANTPVSIDVGIGSTKNVRLLPKYGQKINFLTGSLDSLVINQNEGLQIYKHQISATSYVWRIHSFNGGFLNVGNEVTRYGNLETGTLNLVFMDGGGDIGLSVNSYARLYDWVQTLPTAQLTTFSDWNSTVQTRRKYSLANANGYFRIPKLNGVFQRNAVSVQRTGEYQESQNLRHYHVLNGNIATSFNGSGGILVGNYSGFEAINDENKAGSETKRTMEYEGGDEARPENVSSLRFLSI